MTAWTNIQLVMQKAHCWQFSFIILSLNYISVSLLSQSQGCIFIICDRHPSTFKGNLLFLLFHLTDVHICISN